MGKLIDEIKSKKTGALYTIRDANTYRSLSDAQAEILLDRAIYNGELVTSGEIFTCADGTMKQFTYDTVMGGDETFNPSDVGATGVSRLFGVFKDNIIITRSENYRNYLCISSNKGASFTSTPLSDYYTSFLKTDDFALIFYAGSDLSSTTFYKTTDGTNFTQVTPFVDGSYSTSEYKGFLSSSSYAYLVDTGSNQTDNKYAWTSDGDNWKVATYPDPANPDAQNVYNKSVFILNDKLHVAYSSYYGTGGIFRLDDVANGTWTQLTPSQVINGNTVVSAGNYMYILNDGTATYYSTNGYTLNSTSDWSEKPQGRVFYCKDTGVYVSVYRWSYSVTYKTSTNGTSWSSSSSAPAANNDPQGDDGTDFVFLYCDIMGTKKLFRIDTGVSIVDKTLTALSYNKTQVNSLISSSGSSAPIDDTTVGYLGQIYIDATNKNAYICVKSDSTLPTYTWQKVVLGNLDGEVEIQAVEGFTEIGSPYVMYNGVMSNFSSSDYAKSTYTFDTAQDFEFYTKMRVTDAPSGTYQSCFVSETKFYVGLSHNGTFVINTGNGSSWDSEINAGSWSANNTYYLKVIRENGTLTASVSTDNENWTTLGSISSSGGSGEFSIGNEEAYTTNYLRGSIDLSKTYIKVGGSVVWKGYTTKIVPAEI